MEFSLINTFTEQVFRGNPATVCFLTDEKEQFNK